MNELQQHIKALGIIITVYATTGIDIRQNTRLRSVVEARQISMYLIHRDTGLGWSAIGRLLNKSHATVWQAWRQVNNLLETNAEFRYKYKNLIQNPTRL